MSTSRVAPAASVSPHDLKKSPPPPNVAAPKLSTGTLNPEAPSCRYSIVRCSRRVLGLSGAVQVPAEVGTRRRPLPGDDAEDDGVAQGAVGQDLMAAEDAVLLGAEAGD